MTERPINLIENKIRAVLPRYIHPPIRVSGQEHSLKTRRDFHTTAHALTALSRNPRVSGAKVFRKELEYQVYVAHCLAGKLPKAKGAKVNPFTAHTRGPDGKTRDNPFFAYFDPDPRDIENQKLWVERERQLAKAFDNALTNYRNVFEYLNASHDHPGDLWSKIFSGFPTGSFSPIDEIFHHPASPSFLRMIPQRVFYSVLGIILELKLPSIQNHRLLEVLRAGPQYKNRRSLGKLKGKERGPGGEKLVVDFPFLSALAVDPILLKTAIGRSILDEMPMFDQKLVAALGAALGVKNRSLRPRSTKGPPTDLFRAVLLVLHYEVGEIKGLDSRRLMDLLGEFGFDDYSWTDEAQYRNFRGLRKEISLIDLGK